MHRRAFALAAITVLGLLSAGCSDDSEGGGDAAVDTTTTTATASPAATTTTQLPSGPASSPEAAAKGLFDAWKDGNREGASRFARQRAINELFSHPDTGDVEYVDQGCAPEGGAFLCSWTYPGGAMQMSVEGVVGTSGYVVDNVIYRAD